MSVTDPAGFRAAGVAAGLKSSGRLDVALVVNDGPSHAAAGVFTANRVQAAPVRWSRAVLASGRLRAALLNSGGANACTGPAGEKDAQASAQRVADRLDAAAEEIAVCSTGLIGVPLPMPQLLAGIDRAAAALDRSAGLAAAEAIRTTDTVAKQAVHRAGAGWSVGGMAKGAGMLAPGLATMLAVLTTDAAVAAGELDRALREATRMTFDRVDTDGCMSTNDTVLLLASGASGVEPAYDEFVAALHRVCADLCEQLVADAEGATKLLRITVTGAATESEAVEVARAVARSNLLKCAVHGSDPNWGRVLSAVGTTRAAFDPDRVDVSMNGVAVCISGAAGEPRESADLSGRDVDITVNLHAGPESATVLTTDLSAAYVHENSAYSS